MENALIPAPYPIQISSNNFSEDVKRVAEALFQRDCRPNTRKAMASDMLHFLQWYSAAVEEKFDIKRVVSREIAAYRDEMQKEGLKPSTVNRRLINVGTFFRTAVELGIIEANPAKGVKKAKTQPLAPKGLTPLEVRRFLKEVELSKNRRDLAVIQLLLGGLRAGEVIGLMVQDVEITERKGRVKVRNAKGNKTRTVPLNIRQREVLSDYMKFYTEEVGMMKPDGPLILGTRGRLTQFSLNKIVGKYAAKAGVQLHPHTLRHVFSFGYLQKHPGDIVGLAQLLGHNSISTTQIYTQNRLEDLELKVEALSF